MFFVFFDRKSSYTGLFFQKNQVQLFSFYSFFTFNLFFYFQLLFLFLTSFFLLRTSLLLLTYFLTSKFFFFTSNLFFTCNFFGHLTFFLASNFFYYWLFFFYFHLFLKFFFLLPTYFYTPNLTVIIFNYINQLGSSSSHHNQRRSQAPGGSKDIYIKFLKFSFVLIPNLCTYIRIICSLIQAWPLPTPTLLFLQTLKTTLATLYPATCSSYCAGAENLDKCFCVIF